MTLRGKDGFPVETIRNKPITNFIRLLIHTNLKQTWLRRDVTKERVR